MRVCARTLEREQQIGVLSLANEPNEAAQGSRRCLLGRALYLPRNESSLCFQAPGRCLLLTRRGHGTALFPPLYQRSVPCPVSSPYSPRSSITTILLSLIFLSLVFLFPSCFFLSAFHVYRLRGNLPRPLASPRNSSLYRSRLLSGRRTRRESRSSRSRARIMFSALVAAEIHRCPPVSMLPPIVQHPLEHD